MTAAQEISEVHVTGRRCLPRRPQKLEALRQSVETLSDYQRKGPPFSMRWGLYVGNALLPEARRIYFEHFQEILLEPTQAALLKTLSALPASPGRNDRYDPAFDALKRT